MGGGEAPWTAPLPACLTLLPHPAAAFLKGLSDKQREEHYFCRDFVRLKKIPTWKETAKGRPCAGDPAGWVWSLQTLVWGELSRQGQREEGWRHLWVLALHGALSSVTSFHY